MIMYDDDYDVGSLRTIDGKWKNVLTSSSNGRAAERVVNAKANQNNVKRPKQGLIMISER